MASSKTAPPGADAAANSAPELSVPRGSTGPGPNGASTNLTLEHYRRSIDNIDAALVHMLAERFRITQAVGSHKKRLGLPPADPTRERQQVMRMRKIAAEAGLDPVFSEKFLRFVIAEVIHHHQRADDDRDTGAAAV